MYSFTTNYEKLMPEMTEVLRLFINDLNLSEYTISHSVERVKKIINKITINSDVFIYSDQPILASSPLIYRRLFSRTIKLSLYKALSAYFKRSLAWGALTGVRPTKLAYEALQCGVACENIPEYLQNKFLVSKTKAELIKDIILNQNQLAKRDLNKVNLYIHVPLCPSRCYYCSFVSTSAKAQSAYIEPYVNSLAKEIEFTKNMLQKLNKSIYSIYIGGGTPTVLSDSQLEVILKTVNCREGIEFTCEAGRPDTITESKLELMKKYNVTRISINPQTLNNKTLQAIGRSHTAEQFYDCFTTARDYNFVINTDLIAGLKNETTDDFCYSLNELIKLKPHNITVHTLSQKNGSELKNSITANEEQKSYASAMMEYAYGSLAQNEYKPYYLYRQKLMSDNLENAGFSLEGFECVNNITTMEESMSVFASGAGGISKILVGDNRIERYANLKDIKLYLEQFNERLNKKYIFCTNLVYNKD